MSDYVGIPSTSQYEQTLLLEGCHANLFCHPGAASNIKKTHTAYSHLIENELHALLRDSFWSWGVFGPTRGAPANR